MFFLLKLLPPRPSFAQDMTPAEREVMTTHAAYWMDLVSKKKAIAFGPVADPEGAWGLGLVEVKDEAEASELEANDPAVKSGIGLRYERLMMPVVRH